MLSKNYLSGNWQLYVIQVSSSGFYNSAGNNLNANLKNTIKESVKDMGNIIWQMLRQNSTRFKYVLFGL